MGPTLTTEGHLCVSVCVYCSNACFNNSLAGETFLMRVGGFGSFSTIVHLNIILSFLFPSS